ncbi:MAG: hypothetical protein WC026_16695 [Hyphomicrobium sp.]|uniref:hypothetical protein n=1 Tax=Hyphomicrobium sp. TaxID=82 RepID=UPI0035633072
MIAVKAIEAERAKDQDRRDKRAEQKRIERDRRATVARQGGDVGATVAKPLPLKEIPPHPPKKITPSSSELSLRSSSAADAADCENPMDEDPKDVLFRDGLRWLAKETGKSENSLRSSVGKMLKLAGGDANAGLVLGVLRDAKRERKADPVAWALGVLSGRANARAGPPQERDYGRGALADFWAKTFEGEHDEQAAKSSISSGNVLSLSVIPGDREGIGDDDGELSAIARRISG